MAKAKGFPVADKPYDGTPPVPGDALSKPNVPNLDDLLGQPPASAQEAPSSVPAPQDAAEEGPLVRLPSEVFETPQIPQGAFSDDPPEGWGSGEGNVADPDPVTSQLDPVAEARRSLLEDAARAAGGGAQPVPPSTTQPVTSRGSRVPEIRQALARAAAHATVRYRSRVTIGAAYQYDGQLHLAPDFIDRNWAAWEDGPAINVPDVGIVKKGQWIVIQRVLDDRGETDFEEIKVYDDGVFRSLFMVEHNGP